MSARDVLDMVKRRCKALGLPDDICNRSFRATGVPLHREADGDFEATRQIADHASVKTTQLLQSLRRPQAARRSRAGAAMRDDFSKNTLAVLAKRVGVRCSNPGCRKLTTGPRTDSSQIMCIGVGAHITAASPGGKRYDASLTTQQRASEDNGIWLCQNDAKLVDNDDERYTVALLREWKQNAEAAALAELEGVAERGAEDAAELELTVGCVVIGSGSPPRTTNKSWDEQRGHCNRHDYELAVAVRNLGSEPLSSYHVDVELPAQVLEQPETHPSYVPGRSSRTRAFFRATGDHAPELFPEDGPTLLTIPYYVDDEMFHHWRGTPETRAYAQPVRITLYRRGLRPVTVQMLFEALSDF